MPPWTTRLGSVLGLAEDIKQWGQKASGLRQGAGFEAYGSPLFPFLPKRSEHICVAICGTALKSLPHLDVPEFDHTGQLFLCPPGYLSALQRRGTSPEHLLALQGSRGTIGGCGLFRMDGLVVAQ